MSFRPSTPTESEKAKLSFLYLCSHPLLLVAPTHPHNATEDREGEREYVTCVSSPLPLSLLPFFFVLFLCFALCSVPSFSILWSNFEVRPLRRYCFPPLPDLSSGHSRSPVA